MSKCIPPAKWLQLFGHPISLDSTYSFHCTRATPVQMSFTRHFTWHVNQQLFFTQNILTLVTILKRGIFSCQPFQTVKGFSPFSLHYDPKSGDLWPQTCESGWHRPCQRYLIRCPYPAGPCRGPCISPVCLHKRIFLSGRESLVYSQI